jgi:hypothetical protein
MNHYESWKLLPEHKKLVKSVAHAKTSGRILAVVGPMSSGKKSLCRSAFAGTLGNDKANRLFEISCRDHSPKIVQQRVENQMLYHSTRTRNLRLTSLRDEHLWLAIYDCQLLKKVGFEWLLRQHRYSNRTTIVITTTQAPIRILTGGSYQPDAFLAPIHVKDWNIKNVTALFESWGQPWASLAALVKQGDVSAIEACDILIKASSGRLGQLAAFKRDWTMEYLQTGSINNPDYIEFSVPAIKALAEMLAPLFDPSLEEKTGRNFTNHSYLPSKTTIEKI